jgi:hypothetical protein
MVCVGDPQIVGIDHTLNYEREMKVEPYILLVSSRRIAGTHKETQRAQRRDPVYGPL